ncbi:unnamed protein product [Prorocentrum cordatum]|uniref:Uncharacterized protein n=1 Tax=Prorocentrum cordatum TaxID=2364126 RepID=A0ABN9UG68_9DINO|nr:unnamed protein product [Polarella glacialis]
MRRPVPEGRFALKNGTVIDVGDFDPVELGPFPRCHPHFEQHEAVLPTGERGWVRNADVLGKGPFPPGHPENPEWVRKSHERAQRENVESSFRWVGLQPNLHLLSLATLCVCLGAKEGVWMFTQPPALRETTRVIQTQDAYWFPVMGSCVLFGMFVLCTYIGKYWIKQLISCGVVVMCTFSFGANLDHLATLVFNRALQPMSRIPIAEESMNSAELLGICIGGLMAAGYFWCQHWVINNVFGVSFCLFGIKLINISSYKTGFVMLSGLFIYDVFWVFCSKSIFGANVMVTVAKGVEAPIKLMFPRLAGGCGELQHSMLGLGDIVVPGLFMAFLAKFDAVKIGQKASTGFVYLHATLVAYVLSLMTTIAAMLFSNAAQPALLYIVPYVLITSVAIAVSRGEFRELWTYDIPEGEASDGATPMAGNAAGEKKSS